MPWEASPWLLLVVFVAGIAGGFANVVAGGGSLVTVPALILTGVPETVANGTSRLGIMLQNFVAVWRYRKAGILPKGILALIVPTLFGAALGVLLAIWVGDAGFRKIFAGIMLVWAVAVALRPDIDFSKPPPPRLPSWAVSLLLFLIGIYGGMIQAAVGYLLLALFTFGMGMPLKQANVLKIVVVCAYMPLAFLLFAVNGKVDWLLGALLSGGQIVGAWLGAGVVIGGGTGVMRIILIIAVIFGALELLGVI